MSTAVGEQLDLLGDDLPDAAPAGPVASWWPDRAQVFAESERRALARAAGYRERADVLDATDPEEAARWRDLAATLEASRADARRRRDWEAQP